MVQFKPDTFVSIFNGDMIISGDNNVHNIKINYCPMCGKKFKPSINIKGD